MAKITVNDKEITIIKVNESDYISLTDMAKSQMQEHVIFKWLSLKNTLDYVGEWELLYNPEFNCTEFGIIKKLNQIAIHQMTILEGTGNRIIEGH